ncbi:bifunctional adenosylcobinamide kinase/adenosylcobinamide-phosphate guanylyltransferase [Dactylosporangium sp. AC04546]|uniref:bifunctional adenosylcobinamide kinase/adenosylcobinamide-phosphate guanylyltransferase n=1 Tax=Dactylosporangium sp. AC04546 TaxID=2862460 RepID=UPI001EDE9149|nr:bifunctional adenosylcobinamide kinase/adenosylcobinamide-phosphate guanylyltransferase [Dactylosporangium sp. AC04546]WVK82240.1 bifunctional adenosylcobinamide kinase/adenosylcobinamide-phosphate guanylyltransferase [Dactylosporangium sp. AC04546]
MRLLVLGGIRSGKSEVAEALVAGADRVRYVATSPETPGGTPDAGWSARLAAHRARRPESWLTEEVGAEPERLTDLLTGAKPDEVVLVDDLGGWLTAIYDGAGDWSDPAVADGPIGALADAVRGCPAALLVLVGPEVGLAVMPATDAGRTFADGSGLLNQRVAAACDGVALVVAGEVSWLRGGELVGNAGSREQTEPLAVPEAPFVFESAGAGSVLSTADGGDLLSLAPGLELPLPDESTAAEAVERLLTLKLNGAGLGGLVPVVRFAGGVQGRPDPRPFQQPRVIVLRGDRTGGFAAGDSAGAADRRLEDVVEGTGTIAMLAATAGASVQAIDCPEAGPAELHDALDDASVDAALTLGWRLADAAANEGVDLLVLASCGAGSDAAAAAVVAVLTGGEPAALLGRVTNAAGFVDDAAWMHKVAAVRDARHRIRARSRDPHAILSMLGGGDLAVATGLLLGAASRKLPIMIDGPVGIAAGLVARDYGAQTRHWLLMPDHGDNPTVKLAADVLGTTPFLSLKLALGEGATALAALPLVNTALTVAAATPAAPPPPADELSEQERIEAEIQRVVADSPTAEMPYVKPSWEV